MDLPWDSSDVWATARFDPVGIGFLGPWAVVTGTDRLRKLYGRTSDLNIRTLGQRPCEGPQGGGELVELRKCG